MAELSEADLLKLVYCDELTGLHNRRYYNKFLDEVDWDGQTNVALAVVDVDHFKRINDDCGHSVGDEVLKEIGGYLLACSNEYLVAIRYAGDEFLLLGVEHDLKELSQIAEGLRVRVAQGDFPSLPTELRPTLSIGVSAFPDSARDRRDLFDTADRALYSSKRAGRNRVTSIGEVKDDADLAFVETLAGFPARELIGRAEAVALGEQLLADLGTAAAQFLLVSGPPGIGKSRYLAQLGEQAEEASFTLLMTKCTQPDKVAPYQVLATLLDRLFSADKDLRSHVLATVKRPLLKLVETLLPNTRFTVPSLRSAPTGRLRPQTSRLKAKHLRDSLSEVPGLAESERPDAEAGEPVSGGLTQAGAGHNAAGREDSGLQNSQATRIVKPTRPRPRRAPSRPLPTVPAAKSGPRPVPRRSADLGSRILGGRPNLSSLGARAPEASGRQRQPMRAAIPRPSSGPVPKPRPVAVNPQENAGKARGAKPHSRPALKRSAPRRREPTRPLPQPRPRVQQGLELASKESQSVELARGLHELLRAVARKRPLTVLIDDVQYIDEGSLEVIERYLRHGDAPILFCGAFSLPMSETESEAIPDFWLDFVEDLRSEELSFRQIELVPLEKAEARELVSALLPGFRASSDFAAAVFEHSKGNPLFIENGLRYLIQRRLIAKLRDEWIVSEDALSELPETLNELVLAQIDGLDLETQLLVRGVSVAGHNVSFADIKEITRARNDGEALEVIEKARRANLLVDSEDPVAPGFEFASGSYRTMSYQTLEEGTRCETHRVVAGLEEERGGDRLAASGKIAYHYREGGDGQRAAVFEKTLAEYRETFFDRNALALYDDESEAILPDCRDELSTPGRRLLPAFLKALSTTVRKLRMYPEGSQVRGAALVDFEQRFAELAVQAPVLTLSFREQDLFVNGKAFDVAAGPVVELLRVNGVGSLTFAGGAGSESLLLLLRELSTRTLESTLEKRYWARFCRGASFTKLSVRQRSFVLRDRNSVDRKIRKARSLDADSVERVREVLRRLSGCLEHVRIYPPGSPLIGESGDRLAGSLGDFFGDQSALTLSVFEGSMVVNGFPIPLRTLGAFSFDLAKLIGGAEVQGLAMLKGLPRAEQDELIRRLAAVSRRGAGLPARSPGPHVVLGSGMFSLAEASWGISGGVARSGGPAAVSDVVEELTPGQGPEVHVQSESESEPDPEPEPESSRQSASEVDESNLARAFEAQPLSPWPSDAAAQRAQLLCELPLDELVHEDHHAELKEVLELLLLNGRGELAGRVMETVSRNLLMGVSRTRQLCAEFIHDFLISAPFLARAAFGSIAAPRLADIMEIETTPEVMASLASTAREIVLLALPREDFRPAARLIWAAGRRREARVGAQVEVDRIARELHESVLCDPRFEILRTRILEGPDEARVQAAHLLEGMGLASLDWIVRLAPEAEGYQAEMVVADLLVALRPQSEDALARNLTPFLSLNSSRRMLQMAIRVCADPTPFFAAALQNPDERVRLAAANAVERLEPRFALKILLWCLENAVTAVHLVAVRGLGQLGRIEALEPITTILQSVEDVELQRECCLALGKIRAEPSLQALERVLFPRFLGKAFHDDVRTAAAWAVGRMAETQVGRDLLARGVDDRSERVRLNAREALERSLRDAVDAEGGRG